MDLTDLPSEPLEAGELALHARAAGELGQPATISQADGNGEKFSPKLGQTVAALEAMLFVSGSPLSIMRLAKVLGVSDDEVRASVKVLAEGYDSAGRGIRVLNIGDEVRLGTAPETTPFVEKLVKEEFPEELTPAVLETLAIVVYRGPIARSEVDFIRGVNSSYILRTLLIRGLIVRIPDSKRANVWLYKPSFELLQLLGVASVVELPNFDTLSKKAAELLENAKPEENVKTTLEGN